MAFDKILTLSKTIKQYILYSPRLLYLSIKFQQFSSNTLELIRITPGFVFPSKLDQTPTSYRDTTQNLIGTAAFEGIRGKYICKTEYHMLKS